MVAHNIHHVPELKYDLVEAELLGHQHHPLGDIFAKVANPLKIVEMRKAPRISRKSTAIGCRRAMGVLTVTLPKKLEAQKPEKKIDVKAA